MWHTGPKISSFTQRADSAKSSIDGWLHVETVVAIIAKFRNASAGNNRRSFFLGQLVIRENFLAMLRRNQRTEVGFGIGRPAWIQALPLFVSAHLQTR